MTYMYTNILLLLTHSNIYIYCSAEHFTLKGFYCYQRKTDDVYFTPKIKNADHCVDIKISQAQSSKEKIKNDKYTPVMFCVT